MTAITTLTHIEREQMDYVPVFLVASIVWTCIYFLIINPLRRKTGGAAKLPPGPYPFPVIGNILQLGHQPHQSLANLSKIHGPLMSLKLGTITTIVVSSPKIAKDILQQNDAVFSSRTVANASNALDHHKYSVGWLPVGNQWRNLRKISKEQMFTSPRLDSTQDLRRQKVQELLDFVHKRSINGKAVDIGKAAFTTSLNLMSNTFFSINLAHHDSNLSQEFNDIVSSIMEVMGKPNVSDFFPVLKSFDLQGLRRRAINYFEKLFEIFDRIIDERLESRVSPASYLVKNDVLGALLNLTQKKEIELSHLDIKHLLLDLFVAGVDTTSSTVEWAMAELLRNPQKMAKAQTELEEVIGNDGVVQESDISRLPYLQAVVKETFRVHPAAPFLVPHKAEADVEVDGFMVPKDAQILVNVWATGRDSSVWLNPYSFLPERFLDSEIDFKGRDFELIPFGAGRRICPGLPLAYRMVHLMVASLLHSFDWRLKKGMEAEDMDMTEKFGITLQKAMPLQAIPTKR